MQSHLFPLVGCEGRGLLPDASRDSHATDVVHEGGPADRSHVGGREVASLRRRTRQLRHAVGVADEVGGQEVGELTDRGEGVLDLLSGQPKLRGWLAGERLVPRRGWIDRQQLFGLAGEQCRDLRIERIPSPLPHNLRGILVAAEQALERGVPCHMHDAKTERDLLALEPAGAPLAVPTLG